MTRRRYRVRDAPQADLYLAPPPPPVVIPTPDPFGDRVPPGPCAAGCGRLAEPGAYACQPCAASSLRAAVRRR